MTAAARQDLLIEEYAIIDDPHERFQAFIGDVRSPAWMESRLRDENLVPGCVSRVWLGARFEDGAPEFGVVSESPALQAIGNHLARIYSGATMEEIDKVEPEFIERLGMTRFLTPTRQRGIRHIRAMIVSRARKLFERSGND